MRVVGRDAAAEAYVVEVDHGGRRLVGRVPETLMRTAPGGADRHGPAYGWLAKNETDIAKALAARDAGRTPPAPYDRVTLGGD